MYLPLGLNTWLLREVPDVPFWGLGLPFFSIWAACVFRNVVIGSSYHLGRKREVLFFLEVTTSVLEEKAPAWKSLCRRRAPEKSPGPASPNEGTIRS